MKIQSLKIQNYLGAKDVEITTDKAALFIAGPNGAGKSSIAEAVRHALIGDCTRVDHKKDFAAKLLTDGATTGSVVVEFDKGVATLTLPQGDPTVNPSLIPTCHEALHACLDPSLFAWLKPIERRAFLFSLMGVKMNGKDVAERLTKRGVDEVKAAQVVPLLAAGFEAAQKEAESKARDAKAAWRAITGETYGANKAAAWKAEGGEAKPLPHTDADIAAVSAEVDALNQRIGAAKAVPVVSDIEARLKVNRERGATYAKIASDLNEAKNDLAVEQNYLERLTAEAAGKPPGTECECPGCGLSLVYDDGKLTEWSQDADIATADKRNTARAKADESRAELARIEKQIAQLTKDLDAADVAAKLADELEAQLAHAEDAEDVAALTNELSSCKAGLKRMQDENNAAQLHNAAITAAKAKTEKAAGYHADVVAWTKIAEALSPDGIPAEYLAEAIVPFNDDLDQAAVDSEWPFVRIEDDMTITYGDRPYALISESQKWRADAMIAFAIAKRSGLNFIMLDRFDVLDAQGRSEAIYFVDNLAVLGIGSLTLGTLKAVPGLPSTIDGAWISHGVVEALGVAA